jgi:hypothetical protein
MKFYVKLLTISSCINGFIEFGCCRNLFCHQTLGFSGNRRCSWGAFYQVFEAYHNMKLVFTFKDTKLIPALPDFTSTSSVTKSRANFRGVIEQMQLARSRYLTKYYQTKFDLSQDVTPYPSEESYEEVLSKFVDIIVSRRGFGVSDPRDMIFAHAGPVQNLNIGNADYTILVAQIFENFARHHMDSMHSYEIFSYVENLEPYERREELPSWVPDWTVVNLEPPVSIMKHGIMYPEPEKGFSAKNRSNWWINFRSSRQISLAPSLLWTCGYVTHRVKDISDILNDEDIQPFRHISNSATSKESLSGRSDWDESDYEKLYGQWQCKLGHKAYFIPPWTGSMWPLWDNQ